jgi:hypothetical protein
MTRPPAVARAQMVAELFGSYTNLLSTPAPLGTAPECDSHEQVRAWVRASVESRELALQVRRAERRPAAAACKQAKRTARALLVLVHPDKFDAAHPACPRGVSAAAAASLNDDYRRLKAACAPVGE